MHFSSNRKGEIQVKIFLYWLVCLIRMSSKYVCQRVLGWGFRNELSVYGTYKHFQNVHELETTKLSLSLSVYLSDQTLSVKAPEDTNMFILILLMLKIPRECVHFLKSGQRVGVCLTGIEISWFVCYLSKLVWTWFHWFWFVDWLNFQWLLAIGHYFPMKLE